MSTISNQLNVTELLARRDNDTLEVLPVTQEEYDLMKYHDPHTIYVTENLSYLGDTLMTINESSHDKLYVGTDIVDFKIYYTVSMIRRFGMVEIARYDNPDDAIRRISPTNEFMNIITSRSTIELLARNLISLSVTPGEFIIQILCIAGFKEDASLQVLIQKINSVTNKHTVHAIYEVLTSLTNEQCESCGSMYTLFERIYILMVNLNICECMKYGRYGVVSKLVDGVVDIFLKYRCI